MVVGFFTSSAATRLNRGRAPRLTSDIMFVLPHTRQSGETFTSVSTGHIILTPDMHTKLYGPLPELEKTVAFIAQAGIGI